MISIAANGAVSVFATDADGDGDIDVLSASWMDDKIAWYESDGGSPPTFTERVISTGADGAVCVYATDVDGDGDIDVLSASVFDWKIAWYESDGGSPPTFTERVISTAANVAVSVYATDVDGDGNTDVLSASQDDDKIAWYENTTPEAVVHLDIKPGSCPNPVNPRSRGVVPMAIVGSSSFDVTRIDVDSLTLARADGVGGIVTPMTGNRGPRAQTEDLATPLSGDPCSCHELGGDGIDDLLLKFSTPDLGMTLELAALERGTSVVLTLRGALLDGTEFEAFDCIVIPGRSLMQQKRGRR